MKKSLLLVMSFVLILLFGCEDTPVDYDAIYNEFYSSVEYIPPTGGVDFCAGIEEGLYTNIEIDYDYPYDTLQDMINNDNALFVYGEVYKIEQYNCISNSVYLMVYESEFQEIRELIRINVVNDITLTEGSEYIFNLVYTESNDVYNLSQHTDSVFYINSSDTVTGTFLEETDPSTLDSFIDTVFK